MHRKVLLLTAIPALLFFLLINSCNKLDTTDIGSGLIPPVDNVNTFDTTLSVTATQGVFNDSTILSASDDHVIGTINDPIFGKTNASLFLELKPTVYPYYWGNTGDTVKPVGSVTDVGYDSIVLCLAYKGFYGDSSQLQTVKVYSINNSVTDFKDSTYKIGQYYPATGALLGQATIDPLRLRDWTIFRNKKDSVQGQIRIKLNDAFGQQLFNRDSTGSGSNNAFYNDSVFRSFYKGFAIVVDTNATGTKGLFYVNLADANTRLEVHFRKHTSGTGVKDTIYNALRFNTTSSSTVAYSARAQYIRRNRTGFPAGTANPNAVYLQTTPGTYANLSVPLTGLYNRIIHRAELIMEKIPDPSDTVLTPPSFLYVDVIDTPNVHWKPVPFDLSPTEAYTFYPSSGSIDYTYFGGFVRKKADPNNPALSMSYYNFNLSRYVQHLLTSPAQYTNFNLRLYAPYQLLYPEFFFGPVSFPNSIAYGRVRLGSGNNANYRLRMHIIYSKI